jgi:hypothetical protein
VCGMSDRINSIGHLHFLRDRRRWVSRRGAAGFAS